MLQTFMKVLKRFVILFVNFILGGIAGFCLTAHFATLYATLGFVVPVILFALILYKDGRGWYPIGDLVSFIAGSMAGFALVLYMMRWIAVIE